MDKVSLKEYLGIVVDMEKNIFLQEILIKQLENEIANLGKAKNFLKPSYPQKRPQPAAPLQPSPPRGEVRRLAKRNFWICFALLWALSLPAFSSKFISLWLVGGTFWSIFLGVLTAGITYFLNRDKDICEKKNYQTAVTVYESALKKYQEDCARIERENQVAMNLYQSDFEAYNCNITKDQQRVELENIKKNLLLEELSGVKDQNRRSREVLKQIYDKNIIFPKYRNLVMVCSLYEYICAGRCDSLEGHEGAYNILELEIRLDKVIVQLDRVISMLGRISQNQYVVYTAIQEANQQSAKILESTYQMVDHLQRIQTSNQYIIEKIQSNTVATEDQTAAIAQQITTLQETSALNVYQTERMQKELHYINRMSYLSGKYDDIFFNLPPV